MNTTVICERSFPEPVSFEELEARAEEHEWCFDAHDVRHQVSFLSQDGLRMVCVFQAPDAEAVRQANRRAGLPFERIYPAARHDPPVDEAVAPADANASSASSSASTAKSVLIVGLDPSLLDFSSPDFAAFPGLDADKVRSGLKADQGRLEQLGYEAEICLTDFGETAEGVVTARLRTKPYDCVLVGAGVRTVASQFLLFEKLVNVIHRHAPQARICFNTKPDDTAAAVLRWA